MFGLYFLTLYSELSEKSYRTLCYAWPGCMSSAILAGAISQSRNEKWNIPTYCSTHWYNKCLALMYSGHGGQPGTVSNKTSSKILFYSQKKYRFQQDQMGLILKTKDAQKSHRNSTRTEYIYIFGYINEKEMDFNSRYYYFTRKMAKTASINIKLSNSPNL